MNVRLAWFGAAFGVALLAALLGTACQPDFAAWKPAQAPRSLPPGVVVEHYNAGGYIGGSTAVTVFEDGRVEFDAEACSVRHGRVSVERITRLLAELSRMQLFVEQEGCCEPVRLGADSSFEGISVRARNGAVHSYTTTNGFATPTIKAGIRLVGGMLNEACSEAAAGIDAGAARVPSAATRDDGGLIERLLRGGPPASEQDALDGGR